MQSTSTSVADYLAELPADRKAAITAVRTVIRKNLPKGLVEQMQYGMITYVVPHQRYPAGYHCNPKDALPFASLASQKNHMALYLMTVSQSPEMAEWLTEQFALAGKKLDMGKSCIRFKKVESLPLDVIGEAMARVSVDDYIAAYEAILAKRK